MESTSPIPGFTPEQTAEFLAEQAATRRANSDPLPGPLAGAFAADPLHVHGITFRKGRAGDFILAKKLNSPLYQQSLALAEHARKIATGELAKDAPPPDTRFTEEESAEIIYQFSVPIQQARADLAKGREFFREKALATIADRVPMDQFPALLEAAVTCFMSSFSTAVHYEADKPEGENIVNFRPQPQAPATASAGGGTLSPASAPATRAASTT